MKVLVISALLQKRFKIPKIRSLLDKAPSNDRLGDRTKKIPFWLRQEISKSILFWKQKTCEFCELFIETFLSFCESYRLTFHTWGYKVTQIYSTFSWFFMKSLVFVWLLLLIYCVSISMMIIFLLSKRFILFWLVWLQKFAEFSVLVNFSHKSFDKLFWATSVVEICYRISNQNFSLHMPSKKFLDLENQTSKI